MRLVVSLAEVLTPVQTRTALIEEDEPDIGALVDHLRNRFGAARVYRALPVESDVPERSVRRVPALTSGGPAGWPDDLPRPARLLARPQRIHALSVLPDHPPAAFVWRRVRHRIRRADGPNASAANGGVGSARRWRCVTIGRWRTRRDGASGCIGAGTG